MDTARGVEIDRLRHDIDATRASIAETVGEVRQKVGEAMQWQTYVDRYPAPVLAAAAFIGVVAGRRLARRVATSERRPGPDPRFGPGWDPAEADPQAPGPARARLEPPDRDRFAAANAAWHRLGSRVEALVNRVIDEVADATERVLVPALVGGVQALLAGHPPQPVNRSEGRST
jgi:hypothetical protein